MKPRRELIGSDAECFDQPLDTGRRPSPRWSHTKVLQRDGLHTSFPQHFSGPTGSLNGRDGKAQRLYQRRDLLDRHAGHELDGSDLGGRE